MKTITYNGPDPISPPVCLPMEGSMQLPRDVPCPLDDRWADALLAADPVAFTLVDTDSKKQKRS